MLEDSQFKPSNRERSREPRGRGFWCGACDANILAAGEKCWRCGKRMSSMRGKAGKPTPRE